MSRWTSGQIDLSLDDVIEMDLDAIAAELHLSSELATMIILTIDGEMGGELVLSFDDVNGRALAATLLKREPSTSGPWTALEESALMETGNILGCAYLRSLASAVRCELVPSPPRLSQGLCRQCRAAGRDVSGDGE